MAALESPREITSSKHRENEENGDFGGLLGMGTGRVGIKMENVTMPPPALSEGWTTMLFKVPWQIMQNASLITKGT